MLRLLLSEYVEKYNAEKVNLLEVLKTYPKLRHDKGPWLCGGALLRLMTNEKLSEGDLDFYFPHSDRRRHFVERSGLTKIEHGASFTHQSWVYPTMPIETNIIVKGYFKSIEEIFRTYDFTIVQLATDGYYIYCNQQTLDDINNRIIRPASAEFSIPRVMKYFYRGFNHVSKEATNKFWEWWFIHHDPYIRGRIVYKLNESAYSS